MQISSETIAILTFLAKYLSIRCGTLLSTQRGKSIASQPHRDGIEGVNLKPAGLEDASAILICEASKCAVTPGYRAPFVSIFIATLVLTMHQSCEDEYAA